MKNEKQRKLVPVRNNPGSYKVHKFDTARLEWRDTNKFLSTRRRLVDGASKREKSVFDSIGQAKDFRAGILEKSTNDKSIHRLPTATLTGEYTFKKLIEDWKKFHFLTIEVSTRQYYEGKVGYFEWLHQYPVREITKSIIDDLVTYWVTELPKLKTRQSFERELTTLTVILNYYRERKNEDYNLPVDRRHYDAAVVVRKPKREVAALSENDLGRFSRGLGFQKNPVYRDLAIVQFGFGLRISEVCGLRGHDFDFTNGSVKIQRRVIWDKNSWAPMIVDGTKNGKVRNLIIPKFLLGTLRRLCDVAGSRNALLFSKEGAPLNAKTIRVAYNRTLSKLGITYVSGTHIMRKAAATTANAVTGDIFAVQQLMDHSSTQVTQRYTAKLDSQKRKVAVALDEIFERSKLLGIEASDENLDVTSKKTEEKVA